MNERFDSFFLQVFFKITWEKIWWWNTNTIRSVITFHPLAVFVGVQNTFGIYVYEKVRIFVKKNHLKLKKRAHRLKCYMKSVYSLSNFQTWDLSKKKLNKEILVLLGNFRNHNGPESIDLILVSSGKFRNHYRLESIDLIFILLVKFRNH